MTPTIRRAVRAEARAKVRIVWAFSLYRSRRADWYASRTDDALIRAVAARVQLNELRWVLREPAAAEVAA